MQALWGDAEPEGAIRTLQTHIFQIRRVLRTYQGPTIATEGRGYRLDADPLAIDAGRFRFLVDEGRRLSASDPGAAADRLADGLALWRGPGVPDVGGDPVASAELTQLAELRAYAAHELVQLRLESDDHDRAVAELRRELGQAPYRELLWRDLVLVLADAGRRPEALLAYREAEQALRRELDVEPDADLRALAERIRAGEPALRSTTARADPLGAATNSGGHGVPPEPAVASVRPPTASVDAPTRSLRPMLRRLRQGRVRRTTVLLGVSLAMLAGLLVAGRIVPGDRAGTAPSDSAGTASAPAAQSAFMPVSADSVAWLAPDGRVIATAPVGALPDGVAVGAASVWVANTIDGTVTRLDARTASVEQTIRVGEDPTTIAYAFDAAWVANSGERTVSRIDPVTNQVVATVTVGIAPAGIASDGRWLWVTDRLDGTISRIDPQTDRVSTYPVGQTPLGVAVTADALWVSDFEANAVVEVDRSSGSVIGRVHVGGGPSSIVVADDAVWVVNSLDGTVSRVDPPTGTVQAVLPVGRDPGGLAAASGAVWVPVASPAGLVRIDTATDAIEHVPLANSPRSVALDGQEPVVTVQAAAGDHRGGTLRIVSAHADFPASPDPAYGFNSLDPLTPLTNDGLVGYQRVGGPDGLTIVPDLAAAMPTSPDGGLTYRFQLRPGIVYSTGEPVRASDVTRSIERAMLAPGGSIFFGNLVGAAACTTHACDLSSAVVANDEEGTVTFRLARRDPNFVLSLAYPDASIVPASTPLAQSTTPLPATGPYMFERFSVTDGIRLVRNPRFTEWSAQAQPDGNPDAIEWRSVPDGQDASLLVQSGAADWVADQLSQQRLAYLATALPAQLHVAASTETFFEVMNTTIPPFNDPRVRRAVNLATDRQAALDAYGGDLQGRITCQVVPPSFGGYAPYCPFTVDPGPDGAWRGPDLAAARALIAAAGVRGQHVTVYGLDLPGHRGVADYFTGLLRQLGFRADTRLMSLDGFWGSNGVLNGPSHVQMAGFWFATQEPAASQMIVGGFTCPDFPGTVYEGYPSQFCDRSIDALASRALALQSQGDSTAANALWATVDRKITDASPAVAAFNPTDVTFVSGRVGGFQDHPVLEVLLDQLWLR